MAEGIEAVFFLRMFDIICNHMGPVKENLLALRRSNMMLLPVLFTVVLVPLKPGAFQQEVKYLPQDILALQISGKDVESRNICNYPVFLIALYKEGYPVRKLIRKNDITCYRSKILA